MLTTRNCAASIAALEPDLLQLHGTESPKRVLAVKARFKLPVMKAIAVETRDDLAVVPDYAEVADRLIFDAQAPRDATRPGGLGKAFDWRLLQNLDPRVPFMLSGGLDPGNVAEAVSITRPGGVDVSSGVERAPGDKDPEKIRAFVRAARAAAAGGRQTNGNIRHEPRSSPIPSATGRTSAAISACSAGASSPRR